MSTKLIELTTVELAQLLDVAQFQREMAMRKLAHHEVTEGPMADYNLEAYTKKCDEFRSAVSFWSAVKAACECSHTREEISRQDAQEVVRLRRYEKMIDRLVELHGDSSDE